MRKIPATILIGLIKVYKLLISPWLGRNCRFEPGCANYTLQAVEQYGALKGSWMGIKRIGRCHPWHEGGFDPVPEPDGMSPQQQR